MNIALLGYGKMGQMIDRIATERGHRVIVRMDRGEEALFDAPLFSQADAAIEFSTPDSGCHLCREALKRNKPVVTGSTGWQEQLLQLQEEVRKNGGGLFAASNYSLGMNLMMLMNERLARLMAPYGEYTPHIEETHHIHKLDAPSGTAIALAQEIIEACPTLHSWQLGSAPAADGVLQIEARREGEVPGIHSVVYHSDIDEITLRHEAYDRRGFALGAVLAAEFLLKHPVGVWGMRDMLQA